MHNQLSVANQTLAMAGMGLRRLGREAIAVGIPNGFTPDILDGRKVERVTGTETSIVVIVEGDDHIEVSAEFGKRLPRGLPFRTIQISRNGVDGTEREVVILQIPQILGIAACAHDPEPRLRQRGL